MLSYVTRGRAGTPSNQYSDYLLLETDSFSSDAYSMSTPVATLAGRASFERDATAAYQNALVRLSKPCRPLFVIVVVDHFLQVWYLTGNQTHASKAIEIMDSWSSTVQSVDPNCKIQLSSMAAPGSALTFRI